MERFPFVDDNQKRQKRLQLMASYPKPLFAQLLSNHFWAFPLASANPASGNVPRTNQLVIWTSSKLRADEGED
jgi:hypothetical protein